MAKIATTLTSLPQQHSINQKFVRDEDERPTMGYNHFSNDIPVISLAGINGGERAEICRKIVAACEDWGIFQVVDHGVDSELVAEMTRLAREFFALPPELVSSYLAIFRDIFHVPDWGAGLRTYGQWPDQPEAWRGVTEEYSAQLMELGCQLLEVVSEAMGLEKDALCNACVEMDQNVLPEMPPTGSYTDPGTITLLLQDQVGGLQATRDGGKSWITVRPVQGAFVGDHCYYLSNGRLKNADHQAVVNSNCSRLSIATFQNPAAGAIVYPLKIEEGEESIMKEELTFAEMYKRKMSRELELATLKKLSKLKT